jgi:hypothetical protein
MPSSGASNSKDLRRTENLIFVKSITVIGDSYFTIRVAGFVIKKKIPAQFTLSLHTACI